MFTTVFLTLFTHSIIKHEIHCAVIWRENLNNISRNSPDLVRNLTILEKIGDLELQNESVTQFETKNETNRIMIRNDKSIDPDGTKFSKLPSFKDENEIPISNPKNQSESNVGGRQPKFFGSLAFLAGLGAGGLATAASDNVHTIVKLLNGPLPVPFGFSRYYAGLYAPPPYLPVSYPVWYPVPSLANNYQNFASPIPVLPSPIPFPVPAPVRQNTLNNNTAGIGRQNSDINLGNGTENIEPDDEEPHRNQEAAATQTELKRTVALKDNDDIVENESPVVSEEEAELRQITNPPATTFEPSTTTTKTRTSTTTMRTLISTSTITTNSTMMNSTEGSNGTVASTPPTNISGYFPFNGYYGGSPQAVNNVMFTTEDPQQRFLSEYSAGAYALPFERPAVFNPYQNGDTYSSPFVNSFSAGEPYPEFLNTVESNRYLYDSENRQNYDGFRPILK